VKTFILQFNISSDLLEADSSRTRHEARGRKLEDEARQQYRTKFAKSVL